ncbi:protein-disulfide isomerase [Sphingobium sp. B7D2B]|nr:DsbA family protein [Sphingobium sp. B7D2B]MCW2364964.1 protein-disulfide isomerase [Sphingobium sp. B7D2B]
MTNKAGAGALFRAAGVIMSALGTRTGERKRGRMVMPALAVALLAGGAAVTYAATNQSPALPTADRAAIESVVRDYILEHPEIIPQAMERLKAKQTAGTVDQNRSALETPYPGAWEGAAQPKVTLVAFMDYACGYCRAALPHIEELVKANPDLRVVYRELPIIADGSANAAKVSLLAASENKFMAFHKAMYAAGGVSSDAILKAARTAGLDADKAKAAIAAKGGDDEFMSNIRLAQALGAEGTPLFVVGDQVFNGLVGTETLQAAVDKARTKG